jgi:rfaE bifunctional protein nucleotidyltransferase chain/domain
MGKAELPDPSDYDVVVVNDYAQGTVSHLPLEWKMAAAAQSLLLWDPHSETSGVIPQGAQIVMPNRREAEVIANRAPDALSRDLRIHELALVASHLRDLWAAQNVTVKLDKDGAVSFVQERGLHWTPAPRRPRYAEARNDATFRTAIGAGDVFCAALTLAISRSAATETALQRAVSAATHYATGSLLTEPFNWTDEELRSHAQQVVARAEASGAVVVAIGGCFDLLHGGHVSLINAAHALGDVVIALINDDRSVARIKGPGRPVCTLSERVANLQELAGVDAIYPFIEDTPATAITRVRPNVFVKGADYATMDLPEIAQLDAVGAVALTVPLCPSVSTSEIVSRIRQRQPEGYHAQRPRGF